MKIQAMVSKRSSRAWVWIFLGWLSLVICTSLNGQVAKPVKRVSFGYGVPLGMSDQAHQFLLDSLGLDNGDSDGFEIGYEVGINRLRIGTYYQVYDYRLESSSLDVLFKQTVAGICVGYEFVLKSRIVFASDIVLGGTRGSQQMSSKITSNSLWQNSNVVYNRGYLLSKPKLFLGQTLSLGFKLVSKDRELVLFSKVAYSYFRPAGTAATIGSITVFKFLLMPMFGVTIGTKRN